MNRNKLIIFTSLPLIIVLSLALSPMLALPALALHHNAPAVHKPWGGTQVPIYDPTLVPILGNNYVEIRGVKMLVIDGYIFDDNIKVTYEIIDYMRIHIDPQVFLANPNDPQIYLASRVGKITWYYTGTDGNDVIFGSGTFTSKDGKGSLLVKSPDFLVTGDFWMEGPMTVHTGWYINLNNR